jgi:hypothetical protein
MQYYQQIDGDIEDEFVYNIYITEELYEVDLFNLMRLAISVDVTSLSYMNGYLFLHTAIDSKVNMKKRLLIRDVITEVHYAKIGAFHKFILFDDLYGLCKLIDAPDEMEYHGENTHLITIIDSPDWVTSEIVKKLIAENKIAPANKNQEQENHRESITDRPLQ